MRHIRRTRTAGLALLVVLTGHTWGQEAFAPPGPNLALQQPYTLDPSPNYGDCSLDPQRTLLTDGEYTKRYFWVQKSTVGWVHKQPVVIGIDLGQVEPIAGASFSTAAGIADVAWPASLWIMVSEAPGVAPLI